MSRVAENVLPHYLVGIKISVVSGENTGPIGLSFRPMSEMSAEMVSDLLFAVAQSNAVFSVTEQLELSATIVEISSGGARPIVLRNLTDQQILTRKKCSIIDPGVSDDMLCLPKSLVLGQAIADGNINLVNVYLYYPQKLKAQAIKLSKKAKVVSDPVNGCSILTLYKFQKVLPQYGISLYEDKKNGNNILFKAVNGGKPINLYFLKNLKHYIVIKNIKGFFGYSAQCKHCGHLHNNTNHHLCKVICKECKSPSPCEPDEQGSSHCGLCRRNFASRTCFEKHYTNMRGDKNICSLIFFCDSCHKIVDLTFRMNVPHVCDEVWCNLCKANLPKTHKCFVKQHSKRSPSSFNIIFFDLECTQDTPSSRTANFKHVPNLCVTQGICADCFRNEDPNISCDVCVNRHFFFVNSEDLNCVDKFLNFLEDAFVSDSVVCIAHNLKGYDGHFILDALSKREGEVKPLMCGWKILKLSWKNITFIDSVSFLQMPLSKFPKAFGLGSIAKGYYPHFFNTELNTNYVGPIPSKEMYGVDNFNIDEHRQFNAWYDRQITQNVVFDNLAELKKYCDLDVTILRRGCLHFMRGFIKVLNINPFLESTTLASAIMLGFRKNFLVPNTLGIVPKGQYNNMTNSSFIGQKWLVYENSLNNGNIVFEHKTIRGNFSVDGFNPETQVVYEFFGCYYHGCNKCFKYTPTRERLTIENSSLNQKLESTQIKLRGLLSHNYTVVTMWECEFNKFLKENPEIDQTLSNAPEILYGPINARHAIYGGIVDVFRTYYKVKPGEKIRSLDFCSLYPFVNKTGSYPVGHPKIYRGVQCSRVDILSINGLIKCKILPPKGLFHPVLPLKIFGRMVMTLCRICAENKSIACDHSDNERVISGTWVLAEVHLAIEMGYAVVEVFEIWEYQVQTYDPITKTGGIFTKYMNTFLKLKQEASGWPQSNMTQDEKTAYIANFYSIEGIRLDPDNIVPNPPSRQLSKQALNSLWGKFIESEMRSQTIVFRKPNEFFNHIYSPGVEVVDILQFGEECVWVNWKYKNIEYMEPLPHQVLPIGAFTTAYGRIRLYREILKRLNSVQLENNVALYCDTDSIYYIEKPGVTFNLPIGDCIGQLTNELTQYGANAYITEFVAVGAKSYSYIVLNPDTDETFQIAKCKGITASFKNMQILTFSNLKSLLFDPNINNIDFRNEKKIKRQKTFEVWSGPETKSIHYTVNKRVVVDDNFTVPYGYNSAAGV